MEITQNVIIFLGLILLLIIIFQLLTGLKIVKVSFKYHKRNGIILVVIAIIHAIAGIIFLLGG